MTGQPAPVIDANRAKKLALEMRCPTCGAAHGDVCVALGGSGFLYALHGARYQIAGIAVPAQPGAPTPQGKTP